MSQKTILKQLLYKSSLSNPENNIERDRSSKKKINKSVHYSTLGLKGEPNDYKELSTKEHKKIMSATISAQNSEEITKKKEYRNIENNGNRSRQDLEIMKIFTSPEWSGKSFPKSTNSIVNSMVNDDNIPLIHTEVEKELSRIYNEAESMEYLDVIQESTDQETEEIDHVEEKQTTQYLPNESFHSVQQFADTEEKELENILQESINESIVENRNSIKSFELDSYNSKNEHEYDINMSFETPEDDIIANNFESQPSYITPNVEVSDKALNEVADKSYDVSHEDDVYECQIDVECECYSYRECCEEEEFCETSPNSVMSIPNLSSEETLDNEALMRYFNFDDFTDSHGSEIVDLTPTGSLNTDVMTRIIRQNKSPGNYMTEKQMTNDESEFIEAMDRIFEETKASLGTLLVEGLYIVSKRHRQNSFKYLGEWLLIQADIRDENQTEEESVSSF
ncbi:uncharacterized protein LOC100571868 [Acyrthosiphon pisum]|uniref:Uncharacterized protein n=1 Tax=Acyrthosiphon pisum TaxID=7029 RepID=A0A8R2ABS3_ACYPI|nr:uncharacterized protein LOC100571868 [Acyrthosiphon pisum]|eukprot:XP_003243901.1 PREDICTED: uncharacterized protein LOC100571868 [Acyrthosiphon pisum]